MSACTRKHLGVLSAGRNRYVIIGVMWLLLAVGCQRHRTGTYTYQTVTTVVRDAETGNAIPGAIVRTDYNEGPLRVPPVRFDAVTDTRGIARIRVARDEQGISIIPVATGYLNYWAGGAYPDGRPTLGSPYTELPRWPFDAVTLTLYAEPPPEVVLVVPDAYTGIIPVSTGYGRRGNPWPGRRRFEVPWKPGRTAWLRDVPQMHGLPPIVTRVRYASGQEVPPGVPRTNAIGWWRIGGGGIGATNLLIGTWDKRRELSEPVMKGMTRERTARPRQQEAE